MFAHHFITFEPDDELHSLPLSLGSVQGKMKLIFVVLTTILVASKAQEGDVQSCHAHASETCRSGTDQWSTEGNSCNAVYGNINGNKRNLQKLMTDHLKQSFQFIVMVSSFNNLICN